MKSILWSLFFVTAFAINQVKADATQALSEILSTYQTVQGQFEQTLVDDKGQIIQDSQGIFTVKTPGYFYWETQTPFPQTLVSNLESVWLYDPDLEQVIIRPYQQTVEQSPALLLSGNTEAIKEHYQVTESAELKGSFILTPKKSEGSFTEIRLVFNGAVLVSMLLKDTLQQTTTLTFSSLTMNEPVANSQFYFVPPPGIDVLVDG